MPYRFDVDALDNGRSYAIQIDHRKIRTTHNWHGIGKEFRKPHKIRIQERRLRRFDKKYHL